MRGVRLGRRDGIRAGSAETSYGRELATLVLLADENALDKDEVRHRVLSPVRDAWRCPTIARPARGVGGLALQEPNVSPSVTGAGGPRPGKRGRHAHPRRSSRDRLRAPFVVRANIRIHLMRTTSRLSTLLSSGRPLDLMPSFPVLNLSGDGAARRRPRPAPSPVAGKSKARESPSRRPEDADLEPRRPS